MRQMETRPNPNVFNHPIEYWGSGPR